MYNHNPKNTTYKLLLHGAAVALLATTAMADYSSTVLSLGPLAYWQLNETKAPTADVATNLGTLGAAGNGYYTSGAVHPAAGPLTNGTGPGVTFPDVNGNRVVVPYQARLAANAPFSVEFWANPIALTSGDSATMCAVSHAQIGNPPGAGDGTRKGWLFYQNGATGWTFRTYGAGNASFNATGNLGLSAGTWYHITGVWDGTNTTLYINGQQAASLAAASYVPVSPNQAPFSVGARGYGSLGFFRYNGSVGEVAFYTNILSPADILSHYQNGTGATPSTPYSQLVLSKAPALYLRFNDPSFTAPDPTTQPVAVNKGSLGTDADGHYQSGSLPGLAGVPNSGFTAPNYAPGFTPDVAGSYIDAGASDALNFTGPFTLVTWFKTAPTDARFQSFIGKGDSSWRAGIDGDGKIRFAYGSNPDATSSATLNDGKWHQLSGVYDGANLLMYIDGLLDTTVAASSTADGSSSSVLIGSVSDYADSRVFKGSLDEVALFGTALTADQIQQIYGAANVAPSISVQPPATVTADEGTTVTVMVTAIGTSTLYYQWTKNGTNLVGRTSSTLTLAGAKITDGGNYALVVTNTYGAVTSSIVALTVHSGPPIVLVPPQSVSLYAGLSTSLSTVAGGSVPFSYQWLFNGTALSGQTATNLTLTSLQAPAAGSYSVRITNPQGSVTSAVALVTVIAPPTTPYAAAVVADGPISYWRLGETTGSVAYDYVGGKNGQYTNVTLGQLGYSASDTNKSAKIGPAGPSYVGNITGIDFSNNTGVTSFSLEAWVKLLPQSGDVGIITKGTGAGGEQFNLDTGAGGAFRFFVRDAAGNAHLCNSTVTPDGNWHHLVATCDGTYGLLTLYVDGAYAKDGGITGGIKATAQPITIGCRQSGTGAFDLQLDGLVDEVAIYNTALSSDQVSAHFNARYVTGAAPSIVSQPASTTNYVSLTSIFAVEAGGPGTLSYQWQFNNANILNQTAATLTLSPLAYASAGGYRVIVTSDFGSVTSSVASVTVLAPPTSLSVGSSLVLHLPFDGNYTDTTGRGNNGTNVGATTLVAGKVGSGALHYSTDTGSSKYNYVTLGQRSDLSFSSNVNFTVAFWIKLPAGYAGGDLPFFCNAAGSYGGPGYTFAPSYGKGGWSWNLNGTAGLYGADNSINDGAWHHLAQTFDRAGAGVTYLDGVQVDSRSVATVGSVDQAASTCIGQDPSGTYGETGSADIDDIGVWRRALTPLEVGGIYIAAASNGVTFATSPVRISLAIQPVGTQVKLTWTGGTLQAAGAVADTYTNVAGATSPFLLTPSGTSSFYRVKAQ